MAKTKILKVGVAGCGAIGVYHIRGYQACKRAQVVAICDSSEQRLQKAAQEFNVSRTYLDWRELVKDPDVDVVSVALPNYLHAPVSISGLNAGKHVF